MVIVYLPIYLFIYVLCVSTPNGTGAGVALGWSSLYFGCRNEGGDFLYREEWQRLKEGGALGALLTAFSRDQEQKVYVTHRLRQEGAHVWHALQQASQACKASLSEYRALDAEAR